MTAAVQRVIVVGGGAVAWIAAAALKRAFSHRMLEVIVIDQGMPDDAPAGRWTLPSQRGIHGLLGIHEPDLLQRTGATFKIASEHIGWQGGESRFLHAHGDIGTDLGGVPFYKFLLIEALSGRRQHAEDFSLAGAAARLGRFARPMGDAKAITASFTYGFHLDEAAYVAYLREHALRLGTQRVEALLEGVELSSDGRIDTLVLASGEKVAGDLFLDCSGRAGSLIKMMGENTREDWSAWLPCDRMLSALAPALPDPPAVTQTMAVADGWLWRAPLARASLAGFAYGSAFTSDEAALAAFIQRTPGISQPPRLQRFSPGRRREFWQRNCVALGAAAVELEPLAGADLHFAQLGIGTLIEIFPLDDSSAVDAAEYNRVMSEHADALRDFTLAHYRAGSARPGEFWAAARTQALPERLRHKFDLYGANGRIELLDFDSFEEVDWAWLLMGSGCWPDSIEMHTRTHLQIFSPQDAAQMRNHVQQVAASMPRHIDYVQRQASLAARPAR